MGQGSVVVSDTINGLPVTTIRNAAFNNVPLRVNCLLFSRIAINLFPVAVTVAKPGPICHWEGRYNMPSLISCLV